MSLLGLEHGGSDSRPESPQSDAAISWSSSHSRLNQPPSPPEVPLNQSLLFSIDSTVQGNPEILERVPLSSSTPSSPASPVEDTRALGCVSPTSSGPATVTVTTPNSHAVQYFAGAHDFAIGTVVSGGYHVHYPQASAVVPSGPSRGEIATIAKWLSSTNYWTYHDAAVSRRAPNTGSWFLESKEFVAWVEHEHPQARLWALGMPGAGKSIISSLVVDSLREKYSKVNRTAVLFAYCRYKDDCTVGDVLRSFLKQLLEMRYLAYHALRPVFDRYTVRQTHLPDAEAEAVLHRILQLFESRYTVIDGLDEVSVDVKSKLLAILGRLPTKVLLFSRPVDATNQALSTHSAQLSITAQPRDLDTFVSDTISGHARLSQLCTPAIAAQVRQKVVARSKGMFLVAALQAEALKSCVNAATLQSTLDSLPDGVDDMYQNTLQRIEGQTKAESDLAKRALIWLARCKRPLTVSELQEALATSESPETGEYDILSVSPVDVILNVCCGLVVVNPASQEISLIHYTAHRFLLQLHSPPFSNHAAMITGTCITTLALHGFMEQEIPNLRSLVVFLSRAALLPYAFHYWTKHVDEVGWEERARHTNFALLEAIKSFQYSSRLPCVACDGEFESSLFYLRSKDPTSQRASPRLDLHTALQIAACSGLTRLLQLLPFDDDPTPLSGSTSLHLALKRGHEGTARSLIETFPTLDVNAQDFSGRSGLHVAIRQSDSETVKMLLNHPSMRVNTRDKSGATPIWEAVCVGQQPILTALLQHPLIDVNLGRGERPSAVHDDSWAIQPAQTDQYAGGITPLTFAVLCNKEAVVDALLCHPTIEPNLCDLDGLTPLLAAIGATNGGPKGEIEKQFTPASLAFLPYRSVNGSTHMAELVLRHPSTDVNLRVGSGAAFTPLMLASMGGRSDIVEVLLAHRDVDVNASSQGFQTAFSWVGQVFRRLSRPESGGHEAGVSSRQYNCGVQAVQRILSHPQLDPDLVCDDEGTTPLMVASMLGLDEMVRMLLSAPRRPSITQHSTWTAVSPISSLFSGLSSIFRGAAVSEHPQGDALASSLSNGTGFSHLDAIERRPRAGFAVSKRVERINQVDSQRRSPLLLALSPLSEDVRATVEALLSHPSIDVNQQDTDGNTALMSACQKNLVDVVQLLLSRDEVHVNVCNKEGNDALMAAAGCTFGDPTEILKLLLPHPGLQDVNRRNSGRKPALHLAVETAAKFPDSTAASVLLASSKFVDVNLRNGAGDTPLHIVAYHGLSDVAAALLRHPQIDVALPDWQGSRAIHTACERRHSRVVHNLLQHRDTNLHVTNGNGNKPLHIAAELCDEEVILGLLRHPSIDVNSTNDFGYAAIHIAARLAGENVAGLRALLKHPSIDVNLRDVEGCAAVDILCRFPNTAALALLLRHPGLEPNALHHHRSFYSACWRHIYSKMSPKSRQTKIDMRRIRHFLRYDSGCVAFTDTDGKTVLHHAAKEGRDDLVMLILRETWDAWPEVDVALRDISGKTALDYALGAGHNFCAQELSLVLTPFGDVVEETAHRPRVPEHGPAGVLQNTFDIN